MGLRILARGGFRNDGETGKPDLESMSLADLADLESELGIKRTSLDRGDRIAAIRAKQAGQVPERKPGPKPEGAPVRHRLVPDNGGRLGTHDRPQADEPIRLPNGGVDQGLVHMDSSLGELWQDLYMDDREPNSFVNEIARIGERVGTGEISLDQALDMLKALKGRAGDKAIEERIQNTINDLDAPKVSLPDLPDTVPAVVKDALQKLADIPTARRTGRIGGSHVAQSVLNKKLDIVRKIDAGWPGRLGEADSELGNRDLHESADGALQMWRLFESLRTNVDVRRWIRDAAIRNEGK